MRQARFLVLFVLAQSLGCLPTVSVSPAGQVLVPTDMIRKLGGGVFQIVVPRAEDGGVKYTEPLPVDLLPFGERNDKFQGIGTAFAISPTRFVTAAHVMPVDFETSRQRYYLRDSSGVTAEVGRITKYSQYRDLVEFELLHAPSNNVVPLEVRKTIDVGATVLTVGNAKGEGIVIRAGSLTSFTSEPIAGKWKFLRFTAPASPGNSGGPLVDTSGRVVGVVVRKSEAENLNYAVPIDELDKLSSTASEFWHNGVPIQGDQKQMFVEWKFSSPLPASLATLRDACRRSITAALAKWASDFDTKFAQDIFPNHPNLQAYLREPSVPFGLGMFAVDGNGKWEISRTNYANKDLTPGQKAHFFISADKRSGQVLLKSPRGVPLSIFFESPKAIADALIHNYSWALNFAGKRIGFETFGYPSETERWVDGLGRPWFTYVWPIQRAEEVLVLDCLTNPAGWACKWDRVPVSMAEGARFQAKRFAARTTFAYYGRLKNWVEFLALPETYRPKLFTNAVVRFDKSLTFDFYPFSGRVDLPLLSETSELDVFSSPDPTSPKDQRIVDVRITPRQDKSYSFGVQEVLEPVEQSSENHVQFWNNLQASKPPYNDVLMNDGKTNVIRRVAESPAQPVRGKMNLYYCHSGTEDSKPELEASCAKFQEAVKIASAPN